MTFLRRAVPASAMAAPDVADQARRSAWLMVLLLAMTNCFSFADRLLVTLLAQPIKASYALTDTQLGLLQGTAFGLFYAAMGLPLAWIADRTSRRNVIVVGAALWSVMTMLAGVMKSFPMFFATRTGVAVGEATLSPSAFSMISDSFPPERLSLPIGVFSAGVPVGTASAFIGGGALYQYFLGGGGAVLAGFGAVEPWQRVFLSLGALGLLVVPLYAFVTEPRRRDLPGVVRAQGRVSEMLPLFRAERTTLVPIILGYAFATFAAAGISSWMPAMLMRSYSMTVGQVGTALGTIFLFSGVLGSLAGGALADFIERRGAVAGKILVAMLAVGLQIIPNIVGPLSGSLPVTLACYAISIILGQVAAAPSAAAIQTLTPNRMRAKVNASYFFVFNVIGVGIGPVIVALFSDYLFPSITGLQSAMALVAAIGGPIALAFMARAYLGMRQRTNTQLTDMREIPHSGSSPA